LRAPFFAVAISATAAAIYAWVRLAETRPEGVDGSQQPRGEWLVLLRSKPFLAVGAVALAVFFTRGTARLTLIPLYGSEELGMTAGEVGLVLSGVALVNLVLVTPAGWLSDRFGPRTAVLPSLAATAGSLVLFAFATTRTSFIAAAGVLALASAVTGPAPAAFAADSAPSTSRGMAFGLYRTAGDLGLLIGPPLAGLVADATGFGAAFLLNGAVVAAAFVVFSIWGRVEPGGSSAAGRLQP
jgi:MFS family permease